MMVKRIAIFGGAVLGITNLWIALSTMRFLTDTTPTIHRPYALVLGAGVRGLTLSGALKGRMQGAIDLYLSRTVDRILISGDGTGRFYNETLAMKQYAIRSGVQEAHILVDQEGTSTLQSMVRARYLWRVTSCYVISQPFHLARAVWLGRRVGIDAWGTPSEALSDEWYYALREWGARTKDAVMVLFLDLPPPPGPQRQPDQEPPGQ